MQRETGEAFQVAVNDRMIEVAPKETILQAALRQGIDFPYSCRVGGCATCKCKLEGGKVRELTEATYILSDQELDDGYILACQSVPKSDLRLAVDLPVQGERQTRRGEVVDQRRLTHDITRLTIRLDAPIAYRAGQFADVTFDALPDTTRSYSFATPPQADGTVEFFVRKVPGGAFSTLANDRDVVGETLTVEGPGGDFFLRPGITPLLLIAGGSGLAPILALLRGAGATDRTRPVTLLFGAREARDLYAMAEIEALRASWQAPFRFVPVLSDGKPDDGWAGARGLVTDHLLDGLDTGADAYLCGPPGMIDAAEALLRERGVGGAQIHADRFLTRADLAKGAGGKGAGAKVAAGGQKVAGVFDYLKFFLFHGVGLAAAATILAGGAYTTIGLLGILALYLVGDGFSGDDKSTPHFSRPAILTVQLWLALPLLGLIVFAAVWSVSPGDPLGFGALIAGLTGYDAIAARDATAIGHHVSAFVLTGLMIGMIGTITAHELTHRTWDRVSMFFGRWLLAFSFDTSFAIEHVYGHHRYVSTAHDPATAPRGRNVYHHILASTLKGNLSAWKIEKRRLQRRGHAVWSWHNAFLRGHMMSVALVALAFAIGGPVAAGFFIACALWGKALLEIVNYMEHYGIVRDPATPVQPRHSWNTTKRISSWSMFNLTRHSHHHAQGEVPYQDLKPFPEAPQMISGYLTTILVAMVPPLWHRLMTPKVIDWDRHYASPGERRLAARANEKSGIAAFETEFTDAPAEPALKQAA
ncbi:fatty acid desaturase [Zavarzinia compransoris]|uniref:fatty acid desaturase n=1 Tax=Zavarzinia marina TaxID=2911065 RepID=UPI001F3A010E|nr:fatty acid desaturase [Zavarzinia marina]MCF4165352.1 fatty acid desaturase [Zavarzinia marina]